jgi:hypothetical protein
MGATCKLKNLAHATITMEIDFFFNNSALKHIFYDNTLIMFQRKDRQL